MRLNPLYAELTKLNEHMIDRNRIEIKHQLASGHFGKVFKGILKPENPDDDDDEEDGIEVAIKAPRVSMLNPESLNDFYQEANTAIAFHHDNVLRCLGMSDEPKKLPYLIFEYMHYGDLATILANHRASTSGCIHNKQLPILTNVSPKQSSVDHPHTNHHFRRTSAASVYKLLKAWLT